jgi:hypothetical protein
LIFVSGEFLAAILQHPHVKQDEEINLPMRLTGGASLQDIVEDRSAAITSFLGHIWTRSQHEGVCTDLFVHILILSVGNISIVHLQTMLCK